MSLWCLHLGLTQCHSCVLLIAAGWGKGEVREAPGWWVSCGANGGTRVCLCPGLWFESLSRDWHHCPALRSHVCMYVYHPAETQYINPQRVPFILSPTQKLSHDVWADADFPCDKAAVLRSTIMEAGSN
jgi:hypothetical protein